jgi:glutathionylspermidine synthase
LHHCKWDPQVGDVSTVAPFALLLAPEAWNELRSLALALAREAVAAEPSLLRKDVLLRLGVPRRLVDPLLRAPASSTCRAMRFDFHWTTEGFRISEVNADVPGGFSESSALPALMAPSFHGARPLGDPAGAWVSALSTMSRGPIGMLWAPGYLEDLQILAYLARKLAALGIETRFAQPAQLEWNRGGAHLRGERLGALFRFYQGEWLSSLPSRAFRPLLCESETPVVNPPASIALESKRFPLVWDDLGLLVPTWRRLLPETVEPRKARGREWLFKGAFSNNGDAIGNSRALARAAFLSPRSYVAQRRFESPPIDTPVGPMFACIGVYVIDGAVAGAYGRISPRPIIDYSAIDVAVLEAANR